MTYIREFINTYHQYIQQEWDSASGLPCLPLPLIDSQATTILLGSPQEAPTSPGWTAASHVSLDSGAIANDRWFALERELITETQGTLPIVFRPNLQLLNKDTPNTQSPMVPVNEPVLVELIMSNPLAVSLMITDVQLVFTFKASGDQEMAGDPQVKHSMFKGFNLPAGAQEKVRLELYPACTGQILITGVQYKLSLTPDLVAAPPPGSTAVPVVIEGQQAIEVKGPRLNSTAAEKCNVVYASDKRLEITVVPPLARLSVIFNNLPHILSCGELHSADVAITNTGPCAISKLLLAISDPNHIYLSTTESALEDKHVLTLNESESVESRVTKRVQPVTLQDGMLKPGDTIRGKLWLHAPSLPGAFDVELLFYLETQNMTGKGRCVVSYGFHI